MKVGSRLELTSIDSPKLGKILNLYMDYGVMGWDDDDEKAVLNLTYQTAEKLIKQLQKKIDIYNKKA